MNLNSPRFIKEILNRYNLALKKRWGQNFLINDGVRNKIIQSLDIRAGSRIWEIGPGLGSLTELILKKNIHGCIDLFEIDRGIIRYLENEFLAGSGATNRVRIIEGDFLKTWKKLLETGDGPDRIVGNLPYNSASAIILSLIEGNALPEKTVFTVQKEVAERMTAAPGSKNYSSFSILCRAACDVRRLFNISPGSFFPRPDVDSSVVELVPVRSHKPPDDIQALSLIIMALFHSRRKTLRNNIKKLPEITGLEFSSLEGIMKEKGFDLSSRAESYSVEDYISLSDVLFRMKKTK